jgi:hypothetical protein
MANPPFQLHAPRALLYQPRMVGLLGAVWLAAVIGGAWSLARHSATPGPVIHAGAAWPVSDRLPHSARTYTLVMTVHPDCPCSRASVNELNVLMARCGGHLNAIVLFAEPQGLTRDSTATSLWKSASSIPGVTCVHDPNEELSARFKAGTSGQTFVYDGQGNLRFNGGITIARGHDGDSDGLDAITAIVNGREPAVQQTPVFGCSLR